MDQDGTTADKVGDLHRPQKRVLQQRRPESFPLLGPVNGQVGDQDDWDRIIPQPFVDPRWGLVFPNGARGESVVPDDPAAPVRDIRPG